MKNKKKTLLMSVAAVLLVAAGVFGTLAFLTSQSKVVTNTFTVGTVEIALDESEVDEYGVKTGSDERVHGNSYKLIPGKEYTKDPVVHVIKESEPSYIFIEVINPLSELEKDGDTTTTIAEQMKSNGWVLTDKANVYRYENVVDARESLVDLPVFGTFTLADDADVAEKPEDITIKAFAIQEEGLTAEEALQEVKFE